MMPTDEQKKELARQRYIAAKRTVERMRTSKARVQDLAEAQAILTRFEAELRQANPEYLF